MNGLHLPNGAYKPATISSLPLALIVELRPKQWTKNLLLFAAPLFAFRPMTVENWTKVIWGFVIFCLLSGVVYIINDVIDLEKDRQHPDKKSRPMAACILNPRLGLGFGIFLLCVTMSSSWRLGVYFLSIAITYFMINLFYSYFFKNIVLIDVLLIATGFVLRALAGAVLIDGRITPLWLALFLAISKRRSEFHLLQENKGSHRKVLDQYSVEFLDQMNNVVATSAIISYSLFTAAPGHSVYLMLTIPIVIYGIFRYLYLIHSEGKGGKPEDVLLEDKPILFAVVLFVILVILIECFMKI
ncbi:UbiA prenyltransferase [Candidatus Desulfosporosinus infrequens]|uniref:UbiA prenyltransferase n=1 Tax=Candidatus Desulfosporosinus infrequens TaxID=2043169 RepID=A0A2U3KV98_9FIRM|nr:UbiA prenyltransferase [Candidatus Desulfosporosinus infrequens]